MLISGRWAQVAVAVKAYITQNDLAFDAMRGGVGEVVEAG